MAASCPDGAVAYWELNETTPFSYADKIADHDGACAGSCPSAQSGGAVSGAQRFNGTSTGITVPAAAGFDWSAGTSFSIEMWVKRTSASINASGEVLVSRIDPATALEWRIEIRDVSGSGVAAFILVDTSGTGAAANQVAVGSKPITINKWHHIVAIRDAAANTNVLYVDGDLDASIPNLAYAAGFDSTAAGLNIGWSDATDTRHLNGLLDEVAVYNRVLTEKEIMSHYYLSRGYCSERNTAVRIMPMGDSITKDRLDSVNDPRPDTAKVGYRKQLYNDLYGNDYWFDFIGSESYNDSSYDTNYAGWGGMRTTHLLDALDDGYFASPDGGFVDLGTGGPYLDAYPTDFILLHIGTNDVSVYKSGSDSNFPNTSISALTDILDEIDAASEKTTVLLARIINRAPGGTDADTATLNSAIGTLADNRVLAGDKIVVIDMENDTGLDYQIDDTEPYANDFHDELHPNPRGYPKLGDEWFRVLDTFMPQFVAPAITATAFPQATKDTPYSYTVTADGTDLTFSLVVNPSGMTIDPETGLVQWTPTAEGSFPVTVRVDNAMPFGQTGADEKQFSVTVSTQPVDPIDPIDPGDPGSGGGSGGGCFIGTAFTADSQNFGTAMGLLTVLAVLAGINFFRASTAPGDNHRGIRGNRSRSSMQKLSSQTEIE